MYVCRTENFLDSVKIKVKRQCSEKRAKTKIIIQATMQFEKKKKITKILQEPNFISNSDKKYMVSLKYITLLLSQKSVF